VSLFFSSVSDVLKQEYPAVAENDTMVLCGESFTDKRKIFVEMGTLLEVTDKEATTVTPPPITSVPTSVFSLISFASTDKIASSTLNIAATTLTTNTLPIIYFVTPTYPRREQFPELIRLGQTLMHVPSLHWIVADDTDSCNPHLGSLLASFGIPFTHLSSPMPEVHRSKSPMPRGVANRRAALNWIRTNNRKTGVLYFGDDDNTFDLRLFNEIRFTKRVSMFPVGLIGQFAVSAPVVKEVSCIFMRHFYGGYILRTTIFRILSMQFCSLTPNY
jgi:Glycosyltransferase family 43